jgi:WD40 repeat protein
LLTKVKTEAPITTVEFHPDGLILGVGLTNGKVIIYDIRTSEKALEFLGPVSTQSGASTEVKQI